MGFEPTTTPAPSVPSEDCAERRQVTVMFSDLLAIAQDTAIKKPEAIAAK
jgi:hypothetical protein